jgi:hypothetical protein
VCPWASARLPCLRPIRLVFLASAPPPNTTYWRSHLILCPPSGSRRPQSRLTAHCSNMLCVALLLLLHLPRSLRRVRVGSVSIILLSLHLLCLHVVPLHCYSKCWCPCAFACVCVCKCVSNADGVQHRRPLRPLMYTRIVHAGVLISYFSQAALYLQGRASCASALLSGTPGFVVPRTQWDVYPVGCVHMYCLGSSCKALLGSSCKALLGQPSILQRLTLP